MGLHDRDYYRDSYSPGFSGFRTRSMVFYLIVANLAVWLTQIVLMHSGERPPVENVFACWPGDVFERGFLWQLLSANFLHATGIRHILYNMLFLFFFGRDLEEIYGKRDFLTFYLLAGVVAMFTQALIGWNTGHGNPILGASGSVMGVIILFVLFYPRRRFLFFGIVPVEAWMIAMFWVIGDLLGVASGDSGGSRGPGIAHFAHLAGGAVGVLYRFVDLRWDTMRRRFGGSGRRSQMPGDGLIPARMPKRRRSNKKIIQFPAPEPHQSQETTDPVQRDPVSAHIDELLDKISRGGRESLSEEDLEFLRKNSQHYKSE